MRGYKKIVWVIGLFFCFANSYAQSYLEFIENKGQWDKQILYKGDISTGSFVLESTGYKVLMYNKDDLTRISEYYHKHQSTETASTETGSSKKTTSAGSDRMKVINPNAGGGNIPVTGTTGSTKTSPGVLRYHIYEMRFLNANKNPQIVPDKAQNTYSNYFIGNDSTKWASNCKTFQAVTYKEIYPGIDVRYYTANNALKYDFIVHPGADVNNIAMYFDGAESLKVREGELHVKTSVDEVKEMAPYTYQLIDNQRTEIPCSFELKGNIVRFRLEGAYSKTATLVIDPTLVFSTFTGSTADNWGYTATYDAAGNFYAGGIVFNYGPGVHFPTSNGAFQETFQGGNTATGEGTPGGFDMAIFKFDPAGINRVYATYLGGTLGNEQPHSLIVDGAGNLVIAGRTSSADYPTKGALQKYGPLGGLWDMVLTKLNATGTALVGSIIIGGGGNDGVNIQAKYAVEGPASIDRNYGDDARSEVILDGGGNIYVASCTQSPDFPTTAVSNQTTTAPANAAGRAQDAVVLKFTPDLSAVLFSVLIGGSDDDAAFVLAINPITNNLFVAGATASTDFPGAKTGVKYLTFQGGICDGFVAEFTPNGVLVRDGYFGTSGNDMIYGIQFDKLGFPYIAGTTTGSWPVVNATFNQPGGKQFISKLLPDLSDFVYSTVFGTNSIDPNISITAFLVDRCENVYVSGWGGAANTVEHFPTSGTTGLPVTGPPNAAYQSTTDNSDFYFFVLAKNAQSQLYGSFFGQKGGTYGEHVDGGTSRFDKNGVIYQAICANCGGGAVFPTTPGVWSTTNRAGDCNLAAIKIAFNLAGIAAGLQASVNGVIRDTSGCVPLAVNFVDTLAEGKKYVWDFNDGSSQVTTTAPNVTHTFNTIGLYRVMLVSIDSNSCNIADTTYINMRVKDDPAALGFTSTKIPPCTSLSFQFTNTTTAIKPFGASSFRWDFGDGTTQIAGGGTVFHTYASGGTYNVKLVLIDTSYCNEPDSITQPISISANVKAQFTTPAFGCLPYTAMFTNTSLSGQSFTWDFGDGSPVSTQNSPSHLYTTTGNFTIRLVATDTSTCNKVDSTQLTITVSSKPSSSFNYTPQPTLPNTAVIFQNTSSGGTNYKWLFGDGDSLVTNRADTGVSHLFNASGTFNACLVVYNNAGCTDTSCQSVSVVVVPGADVPKAFSPNGDGLNDRIYVRGYGITKMTWRIYNRWGQVVYLGTDISEGWDGKYKGKLQAQDVYHYTLDAEFSSHDRVSKKGDFTLLR